MMKNAFYFMIKGLSVLKILKVFPDFCGHVGKQLDDTAKINFKIYDVTDWEASDLNTHIAQYF